MRLIFLFCFIIAIVFTTHSVGIALNQEKVQGNLKGYVIDKDTKAPLISANVILVGTKRGAATDLKGMFIIQNLPVGSYVLQFDYIGYEQLKKNRCNSSP